MHFCADAYINLGIEKCNKRLYSILYCIVPTLTSQTLPTNAFDVNNVGNSLTAVQIVQDS